jgi:hypothetical protein
VAHSWLVGWGSSARSRPVSGPAWAPPGGAPRTPCVAHSWLVGWGSSARFCARRSPTARRDYRERTK